MAYRATRESTTLSQSEINDEARSIFEMGLDGQSSLMSDCEREFIESMGNKLDVGYDISVKQLWWLRDLKDKYL